MALLPPGHPPDTSAAPAGLQFVADASRNFTTLPPQLKRVFYVGDGKTTGGTARNFRATSRIVTAPRRGQHGVRCGTGQTPVARRSGGI